MTHTDCPSLAIDLSRDFPRSPHEKLGGHVIAARALDKCRAVVAGCAGEYHFDCPLDRVFFDFAEIDSGAFREAVEAGATDEQMEEWVRTHTQRSEDAVKLWNVEMQNKRVIDLPAHVQLFLHDYIDTYLPRGRYPYIWFDVYDLEEKRL